MISREVLRKTCSLPLETLQPAQAYAACRALGTLARWWLRPEVLQRADEYDPSFPALTSREQPPLPTRPGSCWVVFVKRAGDLPLLRDAFLLPLCWRAEQSHSSSLPSTLIALAEDVLRMVKHEGQWGLTPADGLPTKPAYDGRLDCESGWASLMGGLLLGSLGLSPRPDVWASGAWGEDGLASVEGLSAKLALAHEWGASVFFVPSWQQQDARELLAARGITLEIGALTATALSDARMAVNAYLARLGEMPPVPLAGTPAEQEQFKRCSGYLLLQPAFTTPEREFYRSHLFQAIIRQSRAQVEKDYPGCTWTHLVTIVSRSPELAELLPRALAVRECLLLHTPDLEPTARECQKTLADRINGVPRPFERGVSMTTDLTRLVTAFLEGVSPERVVIDLTPGTKQMTYALSRIARPGNWLACLEARFLNDRRSEPGSERIHLWPVENGA